MSGYLSDVVKPQTEEVSHDRTTSEDDQGHGVEESLPPPPARLPGRSHRAGPTLAAIARGDHQREDRGLSAVS